MEVVEMMKKIDKMDLILKQLPPRRSIFLRNEYLGARAEGCDVESAAQFALDQLTSDELRIFGKVG
jgi:hypothetical protein